MTQQALEPDQGQPSEGTGLYWNRSNSGTFSPVRGE